MEGRLRRGGAEDGRLTRAAADTSSLDIADVRRRIRAAPLRAYDNLESAPFATGEALSRRVRSLTGDGFRKLGFEIDVSDPDFSAGTRSFQFLLHAWDPLSTLLSALLPLTEAGALAPALAYAKAWIGRFQGPAQKAGIAAVIEAARTGEDEVWEGMATGMRAFRLAALIDVAARSNAVQDATLARLVRALQFHFRVLREPAQFQSWSNHGLYQTLGLLAATARLGWLQGGEGLDDIGRERLATLLSEHFDPEGVHLEHSPTYHANLLGSLIGARNAGLLEGTAAAATIAGAERALSWMVTPSGKLAAFGDSSPSDVGSDMAGAGRFRDPGLRYLVSDGAIGDPPAPGAILYRNAGYAFARLYDPYFGEDPEQARYLAQGGAFHSRVHKHADHLTFSWSEGARDILVQPGRYGYLDRTEPGSAAHEQGHWYDDPKRMFVESTRAHNCVEVDGKNHPRKSARPFGGGVRQAETFRGVALFRSAAPLDRKVRQQRLLLLRPRDFLLVIDTLEGSGDDHAYRQWFQLDPAWEADERGGGYRGSAGLRTLQILDLTGRATAEPVRRGETEPRLQGWVSPRDGELTPASSLCFRLDGASVEFVTLFSLSDAPVTDADIGAWSPEGRTLGWLQDGRRTRVVLTGAPPRRVKAAVEQTAA